MASLATINVRFSVDLKQFSSEMQNALRQIEKTGKEFQKVGRMMSTYVTTPILAAAAASIKFASDYDESLNKVDAAFKGSSAEVRAFAKTSLETFGIAEGTALDMAAAYGDMGTSMGLTRAEAAKMSTSLVGLAGDLASFKNISIDVANTALASIFTGETESLKKMGIVMTEVNLIQFALNSGIKKNYKEMSQAEKVNLRYNYVLSVTKNSQGDFARTSGGAANQMRIFQESMKQLAQQFGAVILPAFTRLVKSVNGIIKSFTELSEPTKRIIIIVAALVAAIGPLLVVIGSLLAFVPAIVSGFTLVSGAMAGIVATVAPVIAGLALLYGAYLILRERTEDAAKATIELTASQKLVQKVTDEATTSIVEQKANLELLLLTARNDNETKAERLKAIKAINKISPEYLGNLTLENINTDKARISLEKYNTALLSGATARAAARLLEENQSAKIKAGFEREKALADYNEKRKEAIAKGWEVEKAFYEENNRLMQFANEALDRKNAKYDSEAELLIDIYNKNKANLKLVEETAKQQDVVAEGTAKKHKNIDPFEAKKSNLSYGTVAAYDVEIAKLKQFRDEVATTAVQVAMADKAIKSLEFGKALNFDPTSLIAISGGFEKLQTEMQAKANGIANSINSIDAAATLMKKNIADAALPALNDAFATLSDGIVESLGLAKTGFQGFIGGLVSTVLKLISMMLASALSQSIAGATASGTATGPAAIFTTPAFIATAVAGVIAAFASIPKFESGGVVGGNSFYGDKILARVNSKELILNQSQQASLYGQLNDNGGYGEIIAEQRISGDSLILIYKRAMERKNRIG
ncbi:hypothetical protein B0A75_04735 [Flavobacterium oncorhynchi]|uniref:Phage tail tape measure protein n=1 Tax=Flavobacterium oncorhynchi TaxID=728056 RepID=A0A226I780_9FLAO|nr:hypothetical protein [Flavobacterium oncorhynchi]OXB01751.1 hypothetical protein B0A75_04735 [Flavobacterium oncorhynchi]